MNRNRNENPDNDAALHNNELGKITIRHPYEKRNWWNIPMSCSRGNKSLHNIVNIARVWVRVANRIIDDDCNVNRMRLQIIPHTLVFAHSRATNDEWYRNLNIKIDAFCVWELDCRALCAFFISFAPHAFGMEEHHHILMATVLAAVRWCPFRQLKKQSIVGCHAKRPVNVGHIKRNHENRLHFIFISIFLFCFRFHSNSLPLTFGGFSSDNNSTNTHAPLCICSIDHSESGCETSEKVSEKTLKIMWKIESWIQCKAMVERIEKMHAVESIEFNIDSPSKINAAKHRKDYAGDIKLNRVSKVHSTRMKTFRK